MKKFTVSISVRGSVYMEVEAETMKDAKEIAENKVGEMDFNCLENIDWFAVDVWEECIC